MNDGTTTRASAAPIRQDRVSGLDEAVARACRSLLALQHEDGHWVFELEADATISAEFILEHYPTASSPSFRNELPDIPAKPRCRRLALLYGGTLD
jgi:squalene-hopene/tetraprenyl-beta-curcumene cyclase